MKDRTLPYEPVDLCVLGATSATPLYEELYRRFITQNTLISRSILRKGGYFLFLCVSIHAFFMSLPLKQILSECL